LKLEFAGKLPDAATEKAPELTRLLVERDNLRLRPGVGRRVRDFNETPLGR